MARLLRTRAVIFVVLLLVAVSVAGRDAAGARLIRDAEIENTIRAYATPLFEAAGLSAGDVRIFIVDDSALNAFVAGGMNMFIHTGLLRAASGPDELIGVIAHETGHIAGGHLVGLSGRVRTGSNAALVTSVLGILTALATGSSNAGAAIAQGGQGIVLANLLRYSRTQEAAADQAGLEFLDRTGQSAKGMRDFLRKIEDQELLPPSQQDAYVRTHPITRERIRSIESHIERSRYTATATSPRFIDLFDRMQAKLAGFLDPPQQTLERVGADDASVPARYARAIAYFRLADLGRALPLIDGLIADEPDNPYFHELKGQMLFEMGRVADALGPYTRANELLPNVPILRQELARTQLETGRKELVAPALRHLLFVTRANPESAFAWDLLAIAYGRSGKFGLSALASAEAALARGKFRDALDHVRRAKGRLTKGSAAWVRADDIRRAAERGLKDASR